LLPQLMQAVNDPSTAPDNLSLLESQSVISRYFQTAFGETRRVDGCSCCGAVE
jgi:hypothetical protein